MREGYHRFNGAFSFGDCGNVRSNSYRLATAACGNEWAPARSQGTARVANLRLWRDSSPAWSIGNFVLAIARGFQFVCATHKTQPCPLRKESLALYREPLCKTSRPGGCPRRFPYRWRCVRETTRWPLSGTAATRHASAGKAAIRSEADMRIPRHEDWHGAINMFAPCIRPAAFNSSSTNDCVPKLMRLIPRRPIAPPFSVQSFPGRFQGHFREEHSKLTRSAGATREELGSRRLGVPPRCNGVKRMGEDSTKVQSSRRRTQVTGDDWQFPGRRHPRKGQNAQETPTRVEVAVGALRLAERDLDVTPRLLITETVAHWTSRRDARLQLCATVFSDE